MDENLIQEIKKSKVEQDAGGTSSKKTTYLIFAINDRLFAFPSGAIKEILKDSEVFPVPFVPSYIIGILNRSGDPYAVIDIAALIGESEQNASLFVVLNDESNTCLKITDVKEFYTASDSEIVRFSENDISEFFDGTLNTGEREIFIINLKAFLKKVGKDLAAS